MRVDALIHALAAAQLGLVTRAQLADLGLSPQQIQRRLSAGVLSRVHPGVYRIAAAPVSYGQRARSAVLAAGVLSANSSRTAARLFEWRGARNYGGVEVTVPAARRARLRGVKVHRSLIFDRHDIRQLRDGSVVTRPERTVIDCAAHVRPEVAARILDAALLSGHTTIDRLWIYLSRYGGPGCPGSGIVKRMLLARDPRDRPLESTLEDEWIEALAPFGITGLVRQYEVETSEGHKRIDLARPERMTGLEFQSRIWHGSEEDYQADCRKRYLLAKLGWLILPVTEFDLHERVREVAADFDSLDHLFLGR